MKPSVALDRKRAAVRELAGRFRAANPRVFGSVLQGMDTEGSDLITGATCCWPICGS